MSAPGDDEDTLIRPAPVSPGAIEAAGGAGERVPEDDTVLLESVQPALPPARQEQEPEATVAPRLHRFRIGTHEPILLDVPAFIGRRPSAPRIGGGVRPRLVQVPSPRREVSATHLRLRQEGAVVVATDLGSTNGTVVAMVGSPPVVLRQGESVVVFPGCVVDIGDGILVKILAAQEEQP